MVFSPTLWPVKQDDRALRGRTGTASRAGCGVSLLAQSSTQPVPVGSSLASLAIGAARRAWSLALAAIERVWMTCG
jgi:hypothetical protein